MIYRLIRRLLTFFLDIFPENRIIRQFILWPLSHKVFPKNYSEIITLRNGLRICVYQDIYDGVNKSIMFSGAKKEFPWEPGTSALFVRLLKNKKNILIAGGHLGYFALLAAKTNPDASIYVFEPVKQMFERLIKNIDLNSFTNIYAEHKALSYVSGETQIVSDGGQSSLIHYKGNDSKEVETVVTTTIDSYFRDKLFPDLVLLDVEGYELFVLDGARQALQSKPDLILEINHKMLAQVGGSEKKVYDALIPLGYSIERISEGVGEDNDRHFNVFATQKQ